MDGIHDLGGVQGFGKVAHKANSVAYRPVFHEPWEHLAYSLLFLGADTLKVFNVDELRHAIERLDPRQYFASPYYDRIVAGTASLYVEKGVLSHAELEALAGGRFALARPQGLGRPARETRPPFEVGDRVRVAGAFVPGHTRMPGYVRGKHGTILHRTGVKWPFPDAAGHGRPAALEPTYHVEFKGSDLWGETAEAASVVVDLWEGYLDKA
ncbi:MAG: nitrile hydratase subunit beta [Nevskia sp.]|nr:nitrile hydratase subunit beta [Nevskia sp.]